MDDGHEPSAVSLAQHAVRLQRVFDRRIVEVLNAHGLSRSELDVLGALAERADAGARPREISSRLLLTTGGLSNILRRLQENGFIEREADALDARSQIIRLTPSGRAIARRAGSAANKAIDRALGPVDTAALAAAAELLHRVLLDIDEDAPVHRQPQGQT